MSNYEKVKAWRKLNPEKVAEQAKRYAARHLETNRKAKAKYRSERLEHVRELDKLGARRRRANDPEGQRRRYSRWRDKHHARRVAIAGRPKPDVCEICGELNIRIVFDHCHKRGFFRGWICDRCNRVLGLVRDSPELLSLLARYLTNGGTQSFDQEQNTE